MICLFIFMLVLKICFIFYIISMTNYNNLSLEVSQNNTPKVSRNGTLVIDFKKCNIWVHPLLLFFFFWLGKCGGLNPRATSHYETWVPTHLDGRWFESILFHIITFLTKDSIDERGYGLICFFYKRHGFFLFLCWILLQILN